MHCPGKLDDVSFSWVHLDERRGSRAFILTDRQGFISEPCPVCTQSEMLDVRNESQSASSFIKKFCAFGLAQRAVVVLWRLVLVGSYDLWCGNTVRVVFVSYISIYVNPLFLQIYHCVRLKGMLYDTCQNSTKQVKSQVRPQTNLHQRCSCCQHGCMNQ